MSILLRMLLVKTVAKSLIISCDKVGWVKRLYRVYKFCDMWRIGVVVFTPEMDPMYNVDKHSGTILYF